MSHPWLETAEAELGERLAGGRIAHAFLIAGPAGTGKRDLAGRFMASLLCLENSGFPEAFHRIYRTVEDTVKSSIQSAPTPPAPVPEPKAPADGPKTQAARR